jgi:hypothetical protein
MLKDRRQHDKLHDNIRTTAAKQGKGSDMRLDLLSLAGPDANDNEVRREIGALVARASPAGGVTVELGPADGAPLLRLVLNKGETQRLRSALDAILKGSDEEIII